MNKCYLILENGQVFEGARFGAEGDAMGEIVFTTAAGSYMGTLTDPCFAGQIVVQTFPQIGNYGVNELETDSDKCHLAGYVVREWCQTPSNFRSQGDIDSYLKSQQVAGVCGVDTRQIARILRESGTMRAAIVSELTDGLVSKLSCFKPKTTPIHTGRRTHPAPGAPKLAILNLGAPHGLIEQLTSRYELHEFPLDATADELRRFPALVITDGPGNPADYPPDTIQPLMGKLPMLGIGMGHLLMALAQGGTVSKLKHGHHGANQPVKRLSDGKMFVTAQNQMYTVAQPPDGAEITHVNFNDGTIAALEYAKMGAVSFQHMPEECETLEILERLVK